MTYYQDVVLEYLRVDRAVFVNPECCIQVDAAPIGDSSSPYWYCDALAVDLRASAVYLCEVSYAKSLTAMLKRLAAWNHYWVEVQTALVRDCAVPKGWPVRPWLFIPEAFVPTAVEGIRRLGTHPGETRVIPEPRITTLESAVPWNHRRDLDKPASIPAEMR